MIEAQSRVHPSTRRDSRTWPPEGKMQPPENIKRLAPKEEKKQGPPRSHVGVEKKPTTYWRNIEKGKGKSMQAIASLEGKESRRKVWGGPLKGFGGKRAII